MDHEPAQPNDTSKLLDATQLRQCRKAMHIPSKYTVYITSYYSDYRAWDLLRQILDEKGFIQEHLPYNVVSWITEESLQEIPAASTSNIDEIEQEVNGFHRRMEQGRAQGGVKREIEWTRGWSKWEGEWTPRPIGL